MLRFIYELTLRKGYKYWPLVLDKCQLHELWKCIAWMPSFSEALIKAPAWLCYPRHCNTKSFIRESSLKWNKSRPAIGSITPEAVGGEKFPITKNNGEKKQVKLNFALYTIPHAHDSSKRTNTPKKGGKKAFRVSQDMKVVFHWFRPGPSGSKQPPSARAIDTSKSKYLCWDPKIMAQF